MQVCAVTLAAFLALLEVSKVPFSADGMNASGWAELINATFVNSADRNLLYIHPVVLAHAFAQFGLKYLVNYEFIHPCFSASQLFKFGIYK